MPDNNSAVQYYVDDKPPLWTSLFVGFQYVATVANFFIFPVILVNLAGVHAIDASSFVSILMFGTALATIFQSLKWGPIGSGMMLPLSPAPSYFPPSYLAVKLGGLPLLYGMTFIAGIMQALISPLMRKIRRFIPAELAGLVIILIGLEVGLLGVKQFNGPHGIAALSAASGSYSLYTIFAITVSLMFGLHFFARGKLRLFCVLISIVSGYLMVYFSHDFSAHELNNISHTSWFYLPHVSFANFHFNEALLVPFAIAALIAAIKVSGSLSALQKMQNKSWLRPDMNNISQGNLADATGTIFSGLMGSMGLNASSSSMSLSLSTGVLSRSIAYFYAAIFISLGFCPKVTLILIYMPKPVAAATLLFLGANLVRSGLKMFVTYLEKKQSGIIAGVSFAVGVSHFVFPDFYEHSPSYVHSFVGSSIALAVVCEIVLNFLFMLRLEDNNLASMRLDNKPHSKAEVITFLYELSVEWDIADDVIKRAADSIAIVAPTLQKPIKLIIRGNGHSLTLEYEHSETIDAETRAKLGDQADHFKISGEAGNTNLQILFEY